MHLISLHIFLVCHILCCCLVVVFLLCGVGFFWGGVGGGVGWAGGLSYGIVVHGLDILGPSVAGFPVI